jgi:Holliday junction resolvasome RuvABC endonuclease subunit
VKNRFTAGIDLGTTCGVSKLFYDGREETYSRKLESNLAGRVRGVTAIIGGLDASNCMGVVIEQPFGAHVRALQELYAMMGAAVLACEQNGLPWSLVHLAKVKSHATGKGNAKKDAMQEAARARWGRDFKPDEADALWCAAYGLDNNLFG